MMKARGLPPRKPARPPLTPEQEARLRFARKTTLQAVVALVLIGGIAWLVGYLRENLAQAASQGRPPRVMFANRPGWMSDYLAADLASGCQPKTNPSVFDQQALVKIRESLEQNPWISKVKQVRRTFRESAGDTIEVDAEFRAPLALVHGMTDDYWFVDAKGVRLPERFSEAEVSKVIYAADGKVNLRVIDGVRNPPPTKAGQVWPGDDVAAGLELAEKLNTQSFAESIERINVANYNGRVERREAQIVLVTRQKTQIRWGRPWSASDAFVEIKPEVKFDTLRKMVARYGKVDAGQDWIDIRFERISTPPVASTQEGRP